MADGSQKYHAFIVPENPEKGVPTRIASNDQEGFFADLYKRLVDLKRGWCYLIIDGVPCEISEPRMVFKVKMPGGATHSFGDPTAASFNPDGSFRVPG